MTTRPPRLSYQQSGNTTEEDVGDIIKVWVDFFLKEPMTKRLSWLEKDLEKAGNKKLAGNIRKLGAQLAGCNEFEQFKYDNRIERLLVKDIRAFIYRTMLDVLLTDATDAKVLRKVVGVNHTKTAITDFTTHVFARLRKDALQIKRGGKKPVLSNKAKQLHQNYKQLLPKWQKAKKDYIKLKNNPNWLQVLKNQHKDLSPNLLKRLGALKGAKDSTPSDLALINASIKCGFNLKQFRPRHIRRVINQYLKANPIIPSTNLTKP